jgi:flagellar basal-body rod protein FlgF
MNRGIYPPLAGAITLERRMEILSHNIGNVQTTGFKKDKPIFETILGQTSGPSVAGIDLFPLIGSLPADRSQGVLAHTGETFDVALQGEGFLVAQTPEGLRYFRGGKLQRNIDGNLVTPSGDPLVGAKGPIKLPPGEIVIDNIGSVSVNNVVVGALRLDQVPQGENIAKVGNLYWTVPENPTPSRETTVHQGMLEKSNVNPSLDMVELIKVTREYEQMQKAIQAMDEMASQAIQAGRVQG